MTSLPRASLLLAATAVLSWPVRARACAGRPPAPVTAFPANGATGVSPKSSIFVSVPSGLPAGLVVQANGQPISLPAGQPLGTGPSGAWLRLPGGLAPSTSYVVSVQENGVPRELTRFTTAPAHDEAPGTPARLGGLRLWRVHYPGKVSGGDCVFSEYEGYIDLAYEPGSLPGTPADEVINVLTLSPRSGGAPQTLVFTGSQRLHLAQTHDLGGNGLGDVPPGGLPSPIFAAWKPELAGDREYCATLTLYGRNDLAAQPTASETLCAPVMNLEGADAAKLPARVADGGVDGGEPASSSACAIGRGAPSAPLALVLVGLLVSRLRRRSRR
jgi:hypothetical protein